MQRVVLISGASRGIGLASAVRLARGGWAVVGLSRSTDGDAALREAGALPLSADVTDVTSMQRAFQTIAAQHGRLDAVIANAGAGLVGCFEDLDDAQIRALFEVNVFGVLALTRLALPALRASQGRVVVISSVAGRLAAPSSSAYAASKFAVEGWAEALRHELAPFRVPVVLIEPGATRTDFFRARARGTRVGTGAYAALSARLLALQDAQSTKGVDPDVVARSIERALVDPAPPLRVPTGAGTRAQLLARRLLPWRVYEGLLRLALRLPEP